MSFILRVFVLSLSPLAFCGDIAAQPAPPTSGDQPFKIRGIVLEDGAATPVSHALVKAVSTKNPLLQYSVATDGSGNFSLTDLPAGKYSLTVQTGDSTPQAYKQDYIYSTAIAVGPQLDSQRILFRWRRPASLSGKILNEYGDPVEFARVFLFRKGIYLGEERFAVPDEQTTGADGTFQFSQLEPGTYFIAAHGRPPYAAFQTPFPVLGPINSKLDVVYPATYYPATLNPSKASAITLTVGQHKRIHLILHAVPALHLRVHGLVPRVSSGSSNTAKEVGVGGVLFPVAPTGTGPGHDLTIGGLSPGRFVISLDTFGRPGNKNVRMTSDRSVEAANWPKITLSGRLALSGVGQLPGGVAKVILSSVNTGTTMAVNPDGSFHMDSDDLIAGRYDLELQGPPGIYLKSIDAKGATYRQGKIEITEGAKVSTLLTAGNNARDVSGIALRDGKPFAGAMVLLLPVAAGGVDFIERDQSDSDGTFAISAVPPGRYRLVAIDNGHDLAYRQNAVIRPYLLHSSVIAVSSEGLSDLRVSVLPRK